MSPGTAHVRTVGEPTLVEDVYATRMRHGSRTGLDYAEGLAQGRIVGTVCRGCGRTYLPPRFACGQCGGRTQMDRVQLAPYGIVDGFDVVHYVPASLASRVERAPWIAAIVRLTEGGYMKCFLEGVEPDKVIVGMLVKLVWQDGEIHHCEPAVERSGE